PWRGGVSSHSCRRRRPGWRFSARNGWTSRRMSERKRRPIRHTIVGYSLSLEDHPMIRPVAACLLSFALAGSLLCGEDKTPAPVTPKETIRLFNGKDLGGLTTWLKDSKRADPRKVFRVTDGQLHISGDGFGYIATTKAYRDYRVVVEYRWGKKTDGGKY